MNNTITLALIASPGHSGQTWLSLLIGSHSRALSLGEIDVIDGCSNLENVCMLCGAGCSFWSEFNRIWSPEKNIFFQLAAFSGKQILSISRIDKYRKYIVPDKMRLKVIRLLRDGRAVTASHDVEWMLVGLAVAIAFVGWFAAHWRYRTYRAPQENAVSQFLLKGWYADALVDRLFVRPFAAMARFCFAGCDRSLFDGTLSGLAKMATGWGRLIMQMTTGRLTTYLSSFAWGLLLLLGWFLLKLVNGGGH